MRVFHRQVWLCGLLSLALIGRAAAAESEPLLTATKAALSGGSYAAAVELAARATAAARQANAPAPLAQALILEAEALLASDAVAAHAKLDEALPLANAANLPLLEADINNLMGLVELESDRPQAAREALAISITLANGARDLTRELRARVNRARVAARTGDQAAKREDLTYVAAHSGRLADSADALQVLTGAGYWLIDAVPASAGDDSALALRLLTDAAAMAVRLGDARGASYAFGYQSNALIARGDYVNALPRARSALHYAEAAGAPESAYRWQRNIGVIRRAQDDLESATDAYTLALQTLETVRHELSDTQGQTGFRHGAGPVYVEFAEVLLRRASRVTAGDARRELLERARTVMESLKGAELEDYFRDDCVAGLKSKTVGIDRLADRTAALYPIVLPDRLALLVSIGDQLVLRETAISVEALAAEVAVLRGRLEKRSTYQYLPHAQQLYAWLLAPIQEDLRAANVNTLVFVPDGVLRTVPLGALFDGKQFVIEQYAVATVPGLTLTDPRPLVGGVTATLIGGLTEGVEGFAPLPAVADELAGISTVFPATVLQDAAFSQQNFAAELAGTQYSLVHVASHGQFSPRVEDSFVLTHAGRIKLNDLESYIGVTQYRQHPVELLTLSACQTAAGNEQAALGLAGIAVKAGARSALATLWSVHDRASATLIQSFYAALATPGTSKAEALRTAQRELLAEPRYRHPAYWSPFLLIGNWL